MVRWFRDRSPRHGIPSVSLRRVLSEARFLGCGDLEVSGCSTDSRRIEPGEVFVAIRGGERDGHDFVARALDRGALAVVVDRPCPEAGPIQVVVPDTRVAHGQISHALAGEPAHSLQVIAIAGAAGRTHTALLARQILEAAGHRVGYVGGLGWSDGLNGHPAGPCEPDAAALATMLSAMVDRLCSVALVELSPASLRRRVWEGCGPLQGVLVTDFPDSVEGRDLVDVRRQHARLLRKVRDGGFTVLNADETEVELLGSVNLDTRLVTFGLKKPADVKALRVENNSSISTLGIEGLGRGLNAEYRILARQANQWALAATSLAWSMGLEDEAIRAGLDAVDRVPGKLEPVREGQPFGVWVDRAPDPDGLRDALMTLRATTRGRLHCVLTTAWRPADWGTMARVCEELADRVILVPDGPLAQECGSAIDAVLAGFDRPARVQVITRWDEAIHEALGNARAGDALLIVERDRWDLQRIAGQTVACDGRSIAIRWLRQHPQQGEHRRTA